MSVQQSNIYKIIVTDKKQAESVVYSGGFCGYGKDKNMLEELKKQVYEANMELPRRGLITYTGAMSAGLTVRAATLSSSQAVWITIN